MLEEYARIKETLKSEATRPLGGIGFVLPECCTHVPAARKAKTPAPSSENNSSSHNPRSSQTSPKPPRGLLTFGNLPSRQAFANARVLFPRSIHANFHRANDEGTKAPCAQPRSSLAEVHAGSSCAAFSGIR